MKNSFIIGFSEECSFPEVIEKLANNNVINISEWVTTKNRGTIDLFDFYLGRSFGKQILPHNVPEDIMQNISRHLLEFCYINSRSTISHEYIEKSSANIYCQINEFNKFVKLIYNIFIEKKIELVIFQEIPHDGAEIILYRMAKEVGIKTIIITNFPHFWDRSFIFHSIEDFGEFKEITNLSQEVKDIKIDYKNFKKGIYYMNNIYGYNSKIKSLKEKITKFQLKYLTKSILNILLPFPIRKLAINQHRMATAIIQYKDVVNYKKTIEEITVKADINKKYVYFPLHLEPETFTIPALAGIYSDQLVAIDHLSRIIPDDFLIYVKENPKQTDILRSDSFFDRLKNIKNARLVNDNTYKLIENSQFVATISGTVGWEAITGGKNTLIFGKSWYQSFPGIFKFSNNIDINEILEYKINKQDLKISLMKLLKKSSKGITYFEFFNPKLAESLKKIYPNYEREKNIDYLYESIHKLIIS